jgi:hypothetical protein
MSFEPVNLDCQSPEFLMAFWHQHHRASKASRLLITGHTGKGSKIACKALANYASNKATAMQCRLRGDILGAQMYENICDRIYEGLPQSVRW